MVIDMAVIKDCNGREFSLKAFQNHETKLNPCSSTLESLVRVYNIKELLCHE